MEDHEIGEILVTAEQLQLRVRQLGEEISRDYAGRDVLLVGILKGAVFFLSDLMRHLETPCEVDFMAVASYGSSTDSSGVVRILKDLDVPIQGRHVVIVEDIVDSGLTLSYLLRTMRARDPASLVVVLAFFAQKLISPGDHTKAPNYGEFIQQVNGGQVQSAILNTKDNTIDFTAMVAGKQHKFTTAYPDNTEQSLTNTLLAHHVSVDVKGKGGGGWLSVLTYVLPFVIFLVFWLFIINQMQGGGSKVMSFGKSRAKRMSVDSPKITFRDVAGVDEAVEELHEIKEFLENPKKFQALGARIPKGVLLYGPPGTGKTLLAPAVPGEAGVPFSSISGSDFVEMFVGVGASRVRDLFEQGKKNAPCIVFIDEIDAVGRHRGAGLGGGHDEREQTLNQLLVEMDGFESNDGVILIAATNRPDILDPALLRPG